MKTYTISESGDSITCELCGMRSHNRDDIDAAYCDNCKYWHEVVPDRVKAYLPHEHWLKRLGLWVLASKVRLTLLGLATAWMLYDLIKRIT